MDADNCPSEALRDLISGAKRRLEEVRPELNHIQLEQEALSNRALRLHREETQLAALIATYRGGPPGNEEEGGAAAHARRATAQDVVDLLDSVGKPMHYREIEQGLSHRGFITGGGQDPANALLATYFNHPRLERVARGTYALRGGQPVQVPAASAIGEGSGDSLVLAVPSRVNGQTPESLRDVFRSPTFHALRPTNRFLQLLSVAYQCEPARFERVLELRGSNVVYFARSKEEILRSGNSTNPQPIPGTPFWVMCTASTETKATRLMEALLKIGFSRELSLAAAEAIRS